MQKLRNSLPTAKQVLGTIIVCLVIGVIAKGLHPPALFAQLFGAMFLFLVTMRNYDPDTFDQHRDPIGYRLRTDRDQLYQHLKAITLAAERDGAVQSDQREVVEARQLLDAMKQRYAPKASSK